MPITRLLDYLDERSILFFDSASKEEILQGLLDNTFSVKELPAKEQFVQAILDREELVTTAIGMGVAIPHAKLPVYTDFFVSVAIIQKGIDWEAIDDSLVRIVFLIGGPDNRQTDYLKLLSSVTVAMRDKKLRKRLMSATTANDVITLLRAAFV